MGVFPIGAKGGSEEAMEIPDCEHGAEDGIIAPRFT
jgi:hypothetical protein